MYRIYFSIFFLSSLLLEGQAEEGCPTGCLANGCPTGGCFQNSDDKGCSASSSGCGRGWYHTWGRCEQCSAGKYKEIWDDTDFCDKNSCKNCPIGKSQVYSTASGCSKCPYNWYAGVVGSTQCTSCPYGSITHGTGSNSLDACKCKAGYSFVGGSCTICPDGTYKASESIAKEHQANCVACPAQSSSNTDRSACTTCGGNQVLRGGVCTSCEVYEYAKDNGCWWCRPGKSLSAGVCEKCILGKYALEKTSGGCLLCEKGKYMDLEFGYRCGQCGRGEYAASLGSIECTPCGRGKYQDWIEQSSCINCPLGTLYTQTGAISRAMCNDCRSGKYGEELSSESFDPCRPCQPGKYQPNTGATSCLICPKGKYSVSSATEDFLVRCHDCAIGKYQNSDGKSECINCAPGTYSEKLGQTSCEDIIQCPQQFYRKYVLDSFYRCIQCPTGKTTLNSYSESLEECVPCSQGLKMVEENTLCSSLFDDSFCDNIMKTRCVDKTLSNGDIWSTQGHTCSNFAEYNMCATHGGSEYGNGGANTACCTCGGGEPPIYDPFTTYLDYRSCMSCGGNTYMNDKIINRCDDLPSTQTSRQWMLPSNYGCDIFDGVSLTCKSTDAMNDHGHGRAIDKCCTCGGGVACTRDTCETGTIYPSESCEACPAGKVSNFGKSDCDACEAGKYHHGSTSICTECTPGKFSNVVGAYDDGVDNGMENRCVDKTLPNGDIWNIQGTCSTYAQNQWCANYGGDAFGGANTACCACGGGETHSTCQACESGKYSDVSGSSICLECVSGKYNTDTMKTKCEDCTPGTISMNGWSSCETCRAGTFESINVRCDVCDRGTYSVAQTHGHCISCPVNTHQALTGSSSCQVCNVGAYSYTKWPICDELPACPGNSEYLIKQSPYLPYNLDDDDTLNISLGLTYDLTLSCQCYSGYEMSVSHNTWACSLCASGKIRRRTSESEFAASSLATNEYKLSLCYLRCMCSIQWDHDKVLKLFEPATTIRCDAVSLNNLIVENQHILDDNPQFLYNAKIIPSHNNRCSLCLYDEGQDMTMGFNRWNDLVENNLKQCVACPQGTYTTDNIVCKQCEVGKYNNDLAQSTCKNCDTDNGYFSGILGASLCAQCKRGKVWDAPELKCLTCEPGKYNNIEARSCELCDAIHYTYCVDRENELIRNDLYEDDTWTCEEKGSTLVNGYQCGLFGQVNNFKICNGSTTSYFSIITNKCEECDSPYVGYNGFCQAPTVCGENYSFLVLSELGVCGCVPGYKANIKSGSEDCVLCPRGTYQDKTQVNPMCKDCPTNTTTLHLGSESILDCVYCKETHYFDLETETCAYCPMCTYKTNSKNCVQCSYTNMTHVRGHQCNVQKCMGKITNIHDIHTQTEAIVRAGLAADKKLNCAFSDAKNVINPIIGGLDGAIYTGTIYVSLEKMTDKIQKVMDMVNRSDDKYKFRGIVYYHYSYATFENKVCIDDEYMDEPSLSLKTMHESDEICYSDAEIYQYEIGELGYKNCYNNIIYEKNEHLRSKRFSEVDKSIPWYDLTHSWFRYYNEKIFIPHMEDCINKNTVGNKGEKNFEICMQNMRWNIDIQEGPDLDGDGYDDFTYKFTNHIRGFMDVLYETYNNSKQKDDSVAVSAPIHIETMSAIPVTDIYISITLEPTVDLWLAELFFEEQHNTRLDIRCPTDDQDCRVLIDNDNSTLKTLRALEINTIVFNVVLSRNIDYVRTKLKLIFTDNKRIRSDSKLAITLDFCTAATDHCFIVSKARIDLHNVRSSAHTEYFVCSLDDTGRKTAKIKNPDDFDNVRSLMLRQMCDPCLVDTRSTVCSSCPTNSVRISLADCQCDVGYTGPDGGHCTSCVAGKYKGTPGSHMCLDCPNNSVSSAGSSCECNIGYTGPDGGTCTECAMGKWKDSTGAALCSDCDTNMYPNHTGANNSAICLVCQESMDSSCMCVAGMYKTECTDRLKDGNEWQDTHADDCDFYTEHPEECGFDESVQYCCVCRGVSGDMTEAHTYSTSVWAEYLSNQCMACPNDSVSPTGSTSLTECHCNLGYTGPNGGQCTACVAGTYKDTTGSGGCVTCPTVSVSSSDSTFCLCNLGYTGPHGRACTTCVDGTYKDTTGSVACSTCPTNSVSSSDSTFCLCNLGYTGPHGGACTACVAGTYKDTMGSVACSTCPISATLLNDCFDVVAGLSYTPNNFVKNFCDSICCADLCIRNALCVGGFEEFTIPDIKKCFFMTNNVLQSTAVVDGKSTTYIRRPECKSPRGSTSLDTCFV